MDGAPGERRRQAFDAGADDYARYRPGYPDDVVDDVVTSSRLERGSRVLEIGCGTGQLTIPLVERGVQIVAVELGPNLAAIARQRLAGHPGAQVEVSEFESWPLPPDPFDAVVAASSLHWISPPVRFSKPAHALKPSGVMTIVHVHHVKGGTPGFFANTQEYYQRWGLSSDPFFEPPSAEDAPVMYPELEERPEFGTVRRNRFEIPRQHNTDTYVGWLKTDSLIRSLDDDDRRRFLSDIQQLIDTRYNGRVSRNFVYDVISAIKRE